VNTRELFAAGKLADAIALARQDVQRDPAQASHRAILFDLMCVLGQWEKATTQLNVLTEMNPKYMQLAAVYQPALECE